MKKGDRTEEEGVAKSWQCPHCQNPVLVETSSDCDVEVRIIGLDGNRDLKMGEILEVHVGDFPAHRLRDYHCSHCLKQIPDVKTREQLVKYLRKIL